MSKPGLPVFVLRFSLPPLAVLRDRLLLGIRLRRQVRQQFLDLAVALRIRFPMTAVERQLLFQHNDPRWTPVAFQRLAEGLFARFDPRDWQLGQYGGGPIAPPHAGDHGPALNPHLPKGHPPVPPLLAWSF